MECIRTAGSCLLAGDESLRHRRVSVGTVRVRDCVSELGLQRLTTRTNKTNTCFVRLASGASGTPEKAVEREGGVGSDQDTLDAFIHSKSRLASFFFYSRPLLHQLLTRKRLECQIKGGILLMRM